MKKIEITLILLLALFFLQGSSEAVNQREKAIDWSAFQTLPIQHQGRIKPLDTFARILLYQISGKTSIRIKGLSLTPIQWLVRVLFQNEESEKDPLFLIENPAIMEDLGLAHKGGRSYVSFSQLAPMRKRIWEHVKKARGRKKEERSLFENQMLALYSNLNDFKSLLHSLAFLKRKTPHSAILTAQFPSPPNLMDYISFFSARRKTYRKRYLFSLSLALRKFFLQKKLSQKLKSSFLKQREFLSKDAKIFPAPKNSYSILALIQNGQYLYYVLQDTRRFAGWNGKRLHIYREKSRLPFEKALLKLKTEFLTIKLAKREFADILRQNALHIFTLIPPLDPKQQKWLAPWQAFLRSLNSKKSYYSPLIRDFDKLYRAYLEGKWEGVNRSLDKIHTALVGAAKKRGNYKKIELEVEYFRWDFFFYSLVFSIFAMLICFFFWTGWMERAFYRASWCALILSYLIYTLGMFLRILITNRPPVSTIYESILFVGWMGVGIFLILEILFRKKIEGLCLFSASVIGSLLLFVARKYTYEGDNLGVLSAVLNSNFWLATHVTTITIGYSCVLVAGLIGHFFILSQFLLPAEKREKTDGEFCRILYGAVSLALIFSFIGTVLGGFWADQSWGRFWGWDPKENGALLIVLWNAILLHAHRAEYIGEWGLSLGVIFGNLVVVFAWWGVNLLSIGLHSYGFSSGIFGRLLIFTGVELGFILLGSVCFFCKRSRFFSPIP